MVRSVLTLTPTPTQKWDLSYTLKLVSTHHHPPPTTTTISKWMFSELCDTLCHSLTLCDTLCDMLRYCCWTAAGCCCCKPDVRRRTGQKSTAVHRPDRQGQMQNMNFWKSEFFKMIHIWSSRDARASDNALLVTPRHWECQEKKNVWLAPSMNLSSMTVPDYGKMCPNFWLGEN